MALLGLWPRPFGASVSAVQTGCASLSSLTPVTYLCTLLGIHCVAAFLQLELFWGYLTVKLFYLPAVPALHRRWWCAPDVQ
ncbi:hypothetical protein SEI61121_08594 [Salmonella enterica subsp. indica serovar 6,14,25:z10:1,(2),7 str. 1121]|uniref:Uncharacterized protein n=1 Tax=Salmonella enterica subsp. indica serovar 6,14,25:z10:1,(2),7 str. 1121 TaxID=1173950 RepID=V1H6Y6_SALER|nr:hypothetical protein SEI61121_08594 [Salmonella enterica subsp. indica serovar 6,14,25:z10:1,(2),7 str. 1121]